jgi:hypothetical protein
MSRRCNLRLPSGSWNNANGMFDQAEARREDDVGLFQGTCSWIVHPTYGSNPKMYSVPSGTVPDTAE